MRRGGELPSIAFLSSYPPTSCGLATFTAALRVAVADGRGSDEGLGVVSLVDSRLGELSSEVVYEHLNGDRGSLVGAIAALNSFDVVSVQHEYGIYGGPDGSEVLDLLAGLEIPAIVTLHTVLSQPSPNQRAILEKVVALAEQTIVMSEILTVIHSPARRNGMVIQITFHICALISAPSSTQPALSEIGEKQHDPVNRQVADGDRQERLVRHEPFAENRQAGAEKFEHADETDQRTVLDENRRLAEQRWQYVGESLRQDDVTHALQIGHTDGLGALDLTA